MRPTPYVKRAHATKPALTLTTCCPPADPTAADDVTESKLSPSRKDPSSPASASLIGSEFSVTTDEAPSAASTLPAPNEAAPSNRSPAKFLRCSLVSSSASSFRSESQNRLLKPSRLSKKSSRPYRSAPHVATAVWYRLLDAPGEAHTPPALHTGTMPGVYSTASDTKRTRNSPAFASSAPMLPSCGSRICDGHSTP